MKKAAILLLGLSLTGCAVETYSYHAPVQMYPTYYTPPPAYYHPPVYNRHYYTYRPYYQRFYGW